MEFLFLLIGIIWGGILAYLFSFFSKEKKEPETPVQVQIPQEAKQRAYEAEVLWELEERIGYSLDPVKIVETITGSIGKLLEYHTVSSILVSNHRIIFTCILQESVNRAFVSDVKTKMKSAFAETLSRQIQDDEIEEDITGTIYDEQIKDPIGSYFTIPVVINSKVIGLIAVASPKNNLYTKENTAILYTITQRISVSVTKLSNMLESEKEKLNALVQSLTDGIIMIDPEWNLSVINPRAKVYLSLNKENVTMLDVLDSMSGKIDLRTKIEEAFQKLTVLIDPDIPFNALSLQIIVIPVKGKSKKLLGSVIVLHDRTKTRNLEVIRDQFEAMMIHDLRAPLASIRSALENLMDKVTDKEHHEKLQIIKSDALDMLQLVDDLLDVSKLDAGKFTVVKNPEDLQDILQQVVDRYKPVAGEKNIQIQLQHDGDLTKIPLDEFRIKQVVTNLLTNAIKYSDHGNITISAKHLENAIEVSVKDEGIGMSRDELPLLFTKYYQVQHTTERRIGTGLGLVVTKGIIEAHGGKIHVDSEPGVGSTFTFTIPLPTPVTESVAAANVQN